MRGGHSVHPTLRWIGCGFKHPGCRPMPRMTLGYCPRREVMRVIIAVVVTNILITIIIIIIITVVTG